MFLKVWNVILILSLTVFSFGVKSIKITHELLEEQCLVNVSVIYSVFLKFKNSKECVRIYNENFSFPLFYPATIFLPFKAISTTCCCVTFQRDSMCYWSCYVKNWDFYVSFSRKPMLSSYSLMMWLCFWVWMSTPKSVFEAQ